MDEMSNEEMKQMLIDFYVNLLRIKAVEKAENEELDYQIQIFQLKLTSYGIDISKLSKTK